MILHDAYLGLYSVSCRREEQGEETLQTLGDFLSCYATVVSTP